MSLDITSCYTKTMKTDYERLASAFRKEQIRREERGETPLTQVGLAKEINLTQTAVSKMMTGAMDLPMPRVLEFAEALNCPVSEISPSVANQLEAAAEGLSVASKIAYKTAKKITGKNVVDILKLILKGKKPTNVEDFEHCGADHGPNTYCLVVQGDAMSPILPPGTLVFVDTDEKPEVGKPCVILKGKKVVFATWKGDDYAGFENDEYPTPRVFALSKSDAVVGKIVEARHNF